MPSLDTDIERLGRPTRARHRCRAAKPDFNSGLYRFVLQIVDRPRQFAQGARLYSVSALFEIPYRTFGNAGLAREEFSGKLLGSCSDFVEVFRPGGN